jgi:ABC-type lipoprotein export system ATPase subunit
VRAGVFHAVVGPSGCGKTTLLHLLAGLERATDGSVEIGGVALEGLSREALADVRREAVAVVPQSAAPLPFLSATENVLLAVRARGQRDGEREAAAALERVGLSEVARQPLARLSAGERQRVALARALAVRPRLILADEPTANLDQRNAIAVARLLHEVTRADGVAIVCATHDASVTREADVVLAMADGRIADT